MTGRVLLDASALIALTIADHEHHDRAVSWAAGDRPLAVCPVVEGALTRYLLRLGESAATAQRVLSALRASPRLAFWPDDLSYAEADLRHVTGHRQATDAYLASLAAHREGRLATLDHALARALPHVVDLIP